MPRFSFISSLLGVALLLSACASKKDSDSSYLYDNPGAVTPVPSATGTETSNLAAPPSGRQSNDVRSAFEALPSQYRTNVIKVSADGGKPNPREWYFVARNSDKHKMTYNLTVDHGEVVEEALSRDPRALLSRSSYIDPGKILVDTDAAWEIAQKFVQAKGKELGSISYVLEQTGKNANPVWSLWCYNPRNRYIGMIKITTATGDIVESE